MPHQIADAPEGDGQDDPKDNLQQSAAQGEYHFTDSVKVSGEGSADEA